MARRWYHVDVDELESSYRGGASIETLCEEHRISKTQLQAIRVRFGIASRPRAVDSDNAPSDCEERQSAASLALSPWVEARIKELREAKVLEEQQAEWQVAQVRLYRYHCSRI